MTRHLDEMRHFILLSEAANAKPVEEVVIEELEELDEAFPTPILEDINAVIFKLQSYRSDEGSEEFTEGLEEGLILASNMLMRLVERYGKAER